VPTVLLLPLTNRYVFPTPQPHLGTRKEVISQFDGPVTVETIILCSQIYYQNRLHLNVEKWSTAGKIVLFGVDGVRYARLSSADKQEWVCFLLPYCCENKPDLLLLPVQHKL